MSKDPFVDELGCNGGDPRSGRRLVKERPAPLMVFVLVLTAGLGGAGCSREELMLAMARRAAAQEDIAPPREITWQTGADPAGRAAGERPPNVVLILADDLGWNDVTTEGGGIAGGSVPTPHIDSIARDGVRFANGYSGHSTCAPSRAMLMSGRYGTRFGFEFTPTPEGMTTIVSAISENLPGRLRQSILHEDVEQDLPYDQTGMPPSEISLAETMKKADYHTVHIGKWHLGGTYGDKEPNGMAAHEQGFDESLLMASGLYLKEDDPGVVNAKLDWDPIDKFLWARLNFSASFNGSPAFEPEGYLTDWYTDQAVRVVEANKDRPFFLYLAHWAPHTPLQATKEDYEALAHIEDHHVRVYAAMVRALDRSVGRVLEALRTNGLEENTIVIFTSDNGGAHYIGIPEVNQPYRGWKITFFEGGIHVPYLMKWPARIPAGGTVTDPVHHFDAYATAAAAAGVPLPDDRPMDGVDLVPHARGEATKPPHEALFWRAGHSQVVLADGWKLQVNDRIDRDWLHHLSEDPTEQTNLASQQPERVAALKALLAKHNAEQANPAWPTRAEMVLNIDKDLSKHDAPDDPHVYTPN